MDTTEEERWWANVLALEYWLLLMAMTAHYPLVAYCLFRAKQLSSAGSQRLYYPLICSHNIFLLLHVRHPSVQDIFLWKRDNQFPLAVLLIAYDCIDKHHSRKSRNGRAGGVQKQLFAHFWRQSKSHAMTSELPLKNRSLTRHKVLPPQALLTIAPRRRRLPLGAVGQK